MNNFIQVNPNPEQKEVGDCTVRAISLAIGQPWEDTYLQLALQGYIIHDMPSSNDVWGSYLMDNGWILHTIPDSCPFCYTLNDFCKEHPNGTYIVATGTHVICVKDGHYLDTWDSGNKVPVFYFSKD